MMKNNKLDKGKIIEDGAHEELLKTQGYYQSMWNMQVGGFLPESEGGDV